jgi:hypothetical protein
MNSSNTVVSQTLDLTTGLGYGLIYQPVIGSAATSAQKQFPMRKHCLHRRPKRR